MAKDLYSAILGIGPGARPPDHYTLLGIARFERDPAAIHRAGLQRMKALKAWDLHPDAETQAAVQDLQNQVGAALALLEDGGRRQRYEVALAATLGVESPAQDAVARRLSGEGLRVAQRVSVSAPPAAGSEAPLPVPEVGPVPAAAAIATPPSPTAVAASPPPAGRPGAAPGRRRAYAGVTLAAACAALGLGIWSSPTLRSALSGRRPAAGAASGMVDGLLSLGGFPRGVAPTAGPGNSAAGGPVLRVPEGAVGTLLAALRSEADPARRTAVVMQLGRQQDQVEDIAPVLYRVFLTDSEPAVASMAQAELGRLGIDVMKADAEHSTLVAAAQLGKQDFDAAAGLWQGAFSAYRRTQIAASLARLAPTAVSGPWLYRMFLMESDPSYSQEIARILTAANIDVASCRTASTAALIAEQIAAGKVSDGDARLAELGLHRGVVGSDTLAVLGQALGQGRHEAAAALAAIDTAAAAMQFLFVLRGQRSRLLEPQVCAGLVRFQRQSDSVVAYVRTLDARSQDLLWAQLNPVLQQGQWQPGETVAGARLLAALVSSQIDLQAIASTLRTGGPGGRGASTPTSVEQRIGSALYCEPLVTALGKLLAGAADRQERLACALILGHVSADRDQAATDLARALRSDRDATVRWAAATALGELRSDPDSAGPALQQGLLNDRDLSVRLACVQALATCADKRAATSLRQAAEHDESSRVREAATSALVVLTGFDGTRTSRSRSEEAEQKALRREQERTAANRARYDELRRKAQNRERSRGDGKLSKPTLREDSLDGFGFGGLPPATPSALPLHDDPDEAWKDRRRR